MPVDGFVYAQVDNLLAATSQQQLQNGSGHLPSHFSCLNLPYMFLMLGSSAPCVIVIQYHASAAVSSELALAYTCWAICLAMNCIKLNHVAPKRYL